MRRLPSGIEIDFKIRMDLGASPNTWWDDSKYASANRGPRTLKDLFGERNFDFAKAVPLVEDCLRASGCAGDATVLDFFAGSGTTAHAVANLNREDGGRRRFVLVEMGEHFKDVVLPRVKKVMFSPEWNAGRPQAPSEEATARSPRIVKYLRLESYDDALNNIEFAEAGAQRAMDLEDYVIKYMMEWETRDSATLLNIEQLSRPFDYRLATHANGANGNGGSERADVAETFNYLLGLKVRTRKVVYDDERKYLVYRGTADGQEVVVIWRTTEGWEPADYRRDQQFIIGGEAGRRRGCRVRQRHLLPRRRTGVGAALQGADVRATLVARRTMPTRKRSPAAGKDLSYLQLEKRLVLLAWLNQQFGFQTNEEALADAKEAAEGFNADGRSHLSVRLETRRDMQVAPAALARYDANIRDHLRAINTRRAAPITLRYFQHLAVLYAEIYLDWFFRRPGALLDRLNRFELIRSTDSRFRDVRVDLEYTRDDLRKLAFWIATGGGKTLLLHLNYHQFLRGNAAHGKPLDSILLITPNEGLSEQHLAEMRLSRHPLPPLRPTAKAACTSAPRNTPCASSRSPSSRR